MAPELLSPSDFGLKSGIPTKESDVYAFGMATYQVSDASFTSGAVTKSDT